jgi:AraC-like DNA-binding protein
MITNLTQMRAVAGMRSVLDGFAARCAAARVVQGADHRALLDAFSRLQRATASGKHQATAQADAALHLAIVQLADVQGLLDVWNTAFRVQDAFRTESIHTCWPDLNVLFEAHRPIVDAICAGDLVLAEDTAKAHMDAVWYRLAEQTDDPSLPRDPLARASTYLAFHLHQPVQLSFLAKYIARTSPGHLARLFRQRYGRSFTQHLCELRLNKAVDLLLRSSQPVGRIAAMVGYQDASRFAEHFRRRHGHSPRQYRHLFAHDDATIS